VFTVPLFLTSTVFVYIPGIKDLLDVKFVNMLIIDVTHWVLAKPVQFIFGGDFMSFPLFHSFF
jgi:Cu+-exporting ATPase